MRSYEMTERPEHLGGGWNVKFIEDGEPAGGGVFMSDEYDDALEACESWVSPPVRRPHP
jgi:hypothetical protein